jgi:outer membrane lipoprotein carrier protein
MAWNLKQTALPALLTASLVWSAQASAGAIDQLREFSSLTKTATGEFQQSQVKRGGKAELTTGAFSFSRPGKFRWDIKKPYEQLMVADGEKAWFFDKDLNQVTVRKTGAAIGATPAAILFGTAQLDKDFDLTEAAARQGLEWLDAVPKNKEAGFEKISIGFAGGMPTVLEIKDSFGQLVIVTLRNVQRNPALNDATFKFVPPKGADVIEQ